MLSSPRRKTYAKDCRVIRHRRRRRLGLLDLVLYPEVLHIAATEDDVLVDVVRGSDLVLAIAASLGTKGPDVLKGDGGVLGVDLVEGSDVSGSWGQAQTNVFGSCDRADLMSLLDIRDIRALRPRVSCN